MKQMQLASACAPWSICAVSSHGEPAHFPQQWSCSPEITGDSGPLKRGHGSTKSTSGDTSALAIMWPVWHPKPFSCHPRRRGGKASQLPEQGSRSEWVLSELPPIQNSEKWIRTSALAVMWRCKWLSRLGCITPDKYFSSQPLTLSICLKKGSSLFVDLVDILVRDSANQGSWKNRLSFFFIWLSCLSEAF